MYADQLMPVSLSSSGWRVNNKESFAIFATTTTIIWHRDATMRIVNIMMTYFDRSSRSTATLNTFQWRVNVRPGRFCT